MIELPYGSGKFSMLVLLPQSGKNVNDIVSLLSADNLNDWQDHFSKENKMVYLPKFEFRFEKSLNENLEALGMVDAFSAAKANLTGISDGGSLAISEVKHKSYIKVDEQGTEAAAVTIVVVNCTSANPEYGLFDVNHPFVFLIREKDTNSILFMGIVNDPSES
jgi:serine protease inhibitor